MTARVLEPAHDPVRAPDHEQRHAGELSHDARAGRGHLARVDQWDGKPVEQRGAFPREPAWVDVVRDGDGAVPLELRRLGRARRRDGDTNELDDARVLHVSTPLVRIRTMT